MSSSVTSIGQHAFVNNSSLTVVDLPPSVTSIGIEAYANCPNITFIRILDTVTSLGGGIFDNSINAYTVLVTNSPTSPIIAYFATRYPTVPITVTAYYSTYITVTSNTINATYGDPSINLGTQTNSPETIIYDGYDPTVISVDSNGIVTILKPGSTTITISQVGNLNYGPGYAQVSVNIVEQPTDINVNSEYIVLALSSPFNLNATTNNTEPITYSSSDTSVATVDSNGLITPLQVGTTTISLIQNSNTYYSTGYSTTDIIVEKNMTTITVASEFTKLVQSPVFNLNATSNSDATINYSSSDPTIASVDSSGNVTVHNQVGTAVITLTQDETAYYLPGYATTDIIVRTTTTISVASEFTKVVQSPVFNLNATSNSDATINYSSSDPTIASVDSSGNVTVYNKVGTAVITLTQDETTYYLPGYATTNIIVIGNDPICFNEGTKILCLNKNFDDEYIPIEQLRCGDLVKTYKHGYRKICKIAKNPMINNKRVWYKCMYKMTKTDVNGLTEDLIVTGGHGILVDDLGEYRKENIKLLKTGNIPKIDDKYILLAAAASKEFEKIENNNEYTYYHFILENNGDDDERFGVWSNGILTETPSKKQFDQHKHTLV